MISTPVLVIILIVALVILAGNTMIALAFLRGRKENFKSWGGHDDKAMDELHQEIQKIPPKKD